MLDDVAVLNQRDSGGVLKTASRMFEQLLYSPEVNQPENDGREIKNIVFAGMGGSALGADTLVAVLKSQLKLPMQVVKSYDLPIYVDNSTLVFSLSYSGNTEETLSCYEQAKKSGAQLAVMASGGKLIENAKNDDVSYVQLLPGYQPRMTVLMQLRGLLKLLNHFNLVDESYYKDLEEFAPKLETLSKAWERETSVEYNLAKQIALHAVGKSGVFFGSDLTAPLAYKWKISWNENAKNTAWHNVYPEFNHNEFMGWSAHPLEKPFFTMDLVTDLDLPRVAQRMKLSDQILSGRRPKALPLKLVGENYLQQAVWNSVLADFTSIYLAVLNGVNPEPVALIEDLKKSLADLDPSDVSAGSR